MARVLEFRRPDKVASRVQESSANLRDGIRRLHSEVILMSRTSEEMQRKTQKLITQSGDQCESRQKGVSAITCKSGEVIPVSGIYIQKHPHLPGKECILMRGCLTPWCGRCGYELRFSLVRAVPHIFELPDFATNQEPRKSLTASEASRRRVASART